MKTVVSLQDLAEIEIRPDRLFEEFRAITASAAAELAKGALVEVTCQACGAPASRRAFEKFGFTYRECERCATVFVSPRPTGAALAAYGRNSAAARFWRERVMPATIEARRTKLMRPRAEWVVDGVAEYCPHATAALDLSAQGELLIEELTQSAPSLRATTTGSLDGPIGAPASADVVTAFDTLDRAPDVAGLIAAIQAALRPGGVLFLTAPSITGFDLQTLWDRSPAIMPPDKLNLLSIDGFVRLFSEPVWQVIELSTPGLFDVENVRHAIAAAPDHEWPRAIRRLVEDAGETARAEFQEYLQRHRRASFARLIVRRR